MKVHPSFKDELQPLMSSFRDAGVDRSQPDRGPSSIAKQGVTMSFGLTWNSIGAGF
jgi:hypothetical protein